jgi:hypothetical protein
MTNPFETGGDRMQYLLLLYSDEQWRDKLPDRERVALTREYYALTADLRGQGAYVTGAPLRPTTTATTVRVRADELVVTDGPFAETKEQLGGFFLIEADSIAEARAWAAKVPAARFGSVEVRPVIAVPAEVTSG